MHKREKMIKDDKARIIGKIISIKSDKFSVELLSGIRNFNVNGFDDIHYFAQLNSYVVIPCQNYYIVAEVAGIYEQDNLNKTNIKEQELNKIYSNKFLEVLPIGVLKTNSKGEVDFEFGVSIYPTLYSDVLYIKDNELDAVFRVNEIETKEENNTILHALEIGKSAIFSDYSIKINIDKFFGAHSAILGNTGSGKSCTITSMIQTLYKKKNYSAVGSTFIFFDVNGEYRQAFESINKYNQDINIKYLSFGAQDDKENFTLPYSLLNIEEWELLLGASEKTQFPILRNALGFAELFSKNSQEQEIQKMKNRILASCILECYYSSDSPISKYQRIQSLFKRGNFKNYRFIFGYSARYGNFDKPEDEEKFLAVMRESILFQQDKLPSFQGGIDFDFGILEESLDMAILYEESYGNRQIRTYCAPMLTRFQIIKNRKDFHFLTNCKKILEEEYLKNLFGISNDDKKESQIIIIDLNSAEDEIVEIISAVITRLIFDALRKAKHRNRFPINLVLEEAHRYIAYDSKRTFSRANQIFDRVAKEGRKYGLFLLVSSQRPSELSKTVLSQCNNFIVHRIQNPDDLSHIRQMTPHISETTFKKLPSIPTQHALIFGSAVNIPTLFKVNEANPKPKSDNNEISKNWFVCKNKKFDILNKETPCNPSTKEP